MGGGNFAQLGRVAHMPAPTLFQNKAANLTRSRRCSVELLSKCSSSRISVHPRYLLTGAEIIAEDHRDSSHSFHEARSAGGISHNLPPSRGGGKSRLAARLVQACCLRATSRA
jgi:hypothetical protein